MCSKLTWLWSIDQLVGHFFGLHSVSYSVYIYRNPESAFRLLSVQQLQRRLEVWSRVGRRRGIAALRAGNRWPTHDHHRSFPLVQWRCQMRRPKLFRQRRGPGLPGPTSPSPAATGLCPAKHQPWYDLCSLDSMMNTIFNRTTNQRSSCTWLIYFY